MTTNKTNNFRFILFLDRSFFPFFKVLIRGKVRSSQEYHRNFTIEVLSSQFYHRSYIIAVISSHLNSTIQDYKGVIYIYALLCTLYFWILIHTKTFFNMKVQLIFFVNIWKKYLSDIKQKNIVITCLFEIYQTISNLNKNLIYMYIALQPL